MTLPGYLSPFSMILPLQMGGSLYRYGPNLRPEGV